MSNLTSRIVDGVHRTPTYVEAGIPFLTVENLTRGPSISFEPCRFVSINAHREYVRRADPQPGDVLVSKDGTLGVARVVPAGLPEFSIFVSVAILRPRLELIVPEFVESFFETSLFHRQLGSQSAGTGLKHIHLEHFRELRVAVPPVDEQARILSALGALRARLAGEADALGKLRRLKRGLTEDLLTGLVRVTNLLSDVAA